VPDSAVKGAKKRCAMNIINTIGLVNTFSAGRAHDPEGFLVRKH